MNMSMPTGINLPAKLNTNLNMGLPASMLGANTGINPLSLPINPLGIDFSKGIDVPGSDIQRLTNQISTLGALDAATMAQLNNPAKGAFNPAQSSMLSSVMQELKSGKFTEMAVKDKAEKETEKTKAKTDKEEEKADKEEKKAADAREKRIADAKEATALAQLQLMQSLVENAKQKQQQPQLQQGGLQVQQQGNVIWPAPGYYAG